MKIDFKKIDFKNIKLRKPDFSKFRFPKLNIRKPHINWEPLLVRIRACSWYPKAVETAKELKVRYLAAKEWSRVHFRRWACLVHEASSDSRARNPLAFLAVAAVLGVTMTLGTLYSVSFSVTVDGESVGKVARRSIADQAIESVEKQGRELLGYDYQVGDEVDYKISLSLKSDLSDEKAIENYLYDQLSEVSDQLRKYEVRLNGRPVGVVEDKYALHDLLDEMKNEYVNENTVSAEFMEEVTLDYIYNAETVLTIPEMKEALKANTTGQTTYEVQQGDTFNGIAYANDTSISDLKALNPKVDINRLMVGDVLTVKKTIPALSIQTVDHVTYEQSIPCPTETREDSSMYKGDSKIVRKGTEGVSSVEANVTYMNGVEQSREIISTTTVKEPTATIKAVGTKERPKTASTGSYAWPIRGRINDYFGPRTLFGKYNFHSGIDIGCSYGAPIKAADGGKVTFSGWKGGYGNLVIITHDNGTKTYYGHNSSLVVSAGQRVYKGQVIAKAGSTGKSTGVHCHFEIRVNNKAVDPLNYLP